MRRSVPHSSAQVHLFSMGGRPFALDVGTSSGFCVDEAAARALGALAGAAAPESGLEEAVQEQRAWRESGCFPSVPPPLGAPQSAAQRVVELSATHRCTLRCAYCYSGHDEATRQTPLDASREVIDATVRWATTAFAEGCPRVHITTGATGEGMLRTDLYDYVCEQVDRAAEATGKQVTHAVGNTNLTLASDPGVWKLLTSPARHVFSVSIDGPPELHNQTRVFADGSGSYEVVAAAAKQLLSEGHRFLPQAVVTGAHPEVTKRYLHLIEMGFHRVALRPVRVPPGDPLAIDGSSIARVKQSYTDFVEHLFGTDDEQLLYYLLKIWTEGDFLGRFLLRVGSRQRAAYRCPAGRDNVCVDTDGGIYACPGMVGTPDLRMGSVFTGIAEAAARVYREQLLVTQKPACRECWARYLCGGGCYHAAYLVNHRLDVPDPADCELMRHLIELAIYILGRLRDDRPAVYAALPFAVNVILDPLCRAQARRLGQDATGPEWRSPEPMRFDRGEQAKERVWQGPGELSGEVHFGWDADSLHVKAELRGRAATAPDLDTILDLYLADPERAATSGVYADWWDELLPHHQVSCRISSRTATVLGGISAVGSAMQQLAEMPISLEEHADGLRVGFAVPWRYLPMPVPGPGVALAVNASLLPNRPGNRQSGMQWLPDCALGVLRLA